MSGSSSRRLRDEYEPEAEVEVDPHDDSIEATLQRAQQAEDDAAHAHDDRVDETTLQPDRTFKKGGGSRRRGPRARKSTGMIGRPTIGDEARSVLGSLRMTPTTAKLVEHISKNHGAKNLAGTLELLATLILSGDAEALLSLRASYAPGDNEGQSGI